MLIHGLFLFCFIFQLIVCLFVWLVVFFFYFLLQVIELEPIQQLFEQPQNCCNCFNGGILTKVTRNLCKYKNNSKLITMFILLSNLKHTLTLGGYNYSFPRGEKKTRGY